MQTAHALCRTARIIGFFYHLLGESSCIFTYSGTGICNGGSDFNDSIPKGDGDGVSPIESSELANGGVDVLIDGPLGNMEILANRPRRLALRNPRQNFTLARREWFIYCTILAQGYAPIECQGPWVLAVG